jgi:hypothetical protein
MLICFIWVALFMSCKHEFNGILFYLGVLCLFALIIMKSILEFFSYNFNLLQVKVQTWVGET